MLKSDKLVNKVIFLLANCIMMLSFVFSSCTKRDCPDPVTSNSIIQDPVTYYATINESDFMDAEVSSNEANVNHGSYEVNMADAWTIGGDPVVARGFFKFNYSTIPTGAKISKATLTMYADTAHYYKGHNDNLFDGNNSWVLRRVNSAWSLNTITWNNQPASDATTEMILPASTSYKQTYIIDFTNFVKDEFNNPATAYGFVMQLKNENPYGIIIFGASDNLDTNVRPKLDIEYTK